MTPTLVIWWCYSDTYLGPCTVSFISHSSPLGDMKGLVGVVQRLVQTVLSEGEMDCKASRGLWNTYTHTHTHTHVSVTLSRKEFSYPHLTFFLSPISPHPSPPSYSVSLFLLNLSSLPPLLSLLHPPVGGGGGHTFSNWACHGDA